MFKDNDKWFFRIGERHKPSVLSRKIKINIKYIVVKLQNPKDKERTWKQAHKGQTAYKRIITTLKVYFQWATIEAISTEDRLLFEPHVLCTTIQLCNYNTITTRDNMNINEPDCIPIKNYLWALKFDYTKIDNGLNLAYGL